MFERFTEKAINVVSEAQRFAKELKSLEVYPEHLLLALVSEAKGVSLKIFRMYGVTLELLQQEVRNHTTASIKSNEFIPFSHTVKDILKRTLDLASKSGNQNILFEHLFLSVITDKNSNIQSILEKFGFQISTAREILSKLVQRKIKKLEHPEIEEDDEKQAGDASYESEALTEVFDRAVSKLSAAGYEILGTEQILASILETENTALIDVLHSNGITPATFEEKLASIGSRQSEYEGKKIIFTPNAFYMMNLALQTAKELGSSVIMPEHIVLSILKSKKGLAYEVLKTLNIDEDKLSTDIIRPIEKQLPETIQIMKLAKEEARRLGRNVVGTEMFLLGIIGEGASDASEALSDIDVTMKDARFVVESLVGYGNEYFDKEIVFTRRAKRVLERAWVIAKKMNKQRIEAVDLLLSILEETDSLAIKVLENLGVDAMDVKHSIQRLNK